MQNFTAEDTSPILRPVETFEEAFHEFPGILDSIQQQAFSRPSPIQVHHHRVDRVLSFFSRVVGIGTPPPPHPEASVFSPPLVRGGGTHSLAGEGVGGPNSNERTYLVL